MKIKKSPQKSLMYGIEYDSHMDMEKIVKLDGKHIGILASGLLIFGFIIFATINFDWWFNEMAGGFFLIGIVAIIISKLPLKESVAAFVKGMEEMVVAALVVGFARGIVVVMNDGQILDTLIYSAATVLQDFHNVVAAQGMLHQDPDRLPSPCR